MLSADRCLTIKYLHEKAHWTGASRFSTDSYQDEYLQETNFLNKSRYQESSNDGLWMLGWEEGPLEEVLLQEFIV